MSGWRNWEVKNVRDRETESTGREARVMTAEVKREGGINHRPLVHPLNNLG